MTNLLPEGRNEALGGTSATVELEAVPADDVVSGSPRQGVAVLGGIGDAEAGIWELRGGVVTDTETDELFIVLSGRARIEFLSGPEQGGAIEVGPGDVMRLVEGTRTRWTVEDHIRKVYIAA